MCATPHFLSDGSRALAGAHAVPSDLDVVVGELALAPMWTPRTTGRLAACGCLLDDPSPVPSALIAFSSSGRFLVGNRAA